MQPMGSQMSQVSGAEMRALPAKSSHKQQAMPLYGDPNPMPLSKQQAMQPVVFGGSKQQAVQSGVLNAYGGPPKSGPPKKCAAPIPEKPKPKPKPAMSLDGVAGVSDALRKLLA